MELFWLSLSFVSSCDISCVVLNIFSMALHIVKIKLTLKLFTVAVSSKNCSHEEYFKGEKWCLSVKSTQLVTERIEGLIHSMSKSAGIFPLT